MKKASNHRRKKPSRWHVFVARIHAVPSSESHDVNAAPSSSSMNNSNNGATTGSGFSSKVSSSKISIGCEEDSKPNTTQTNPKNGYELPSSRDNSSHHEYDIECLSSSMHNFKMTTDPINSTVPTQNHNDFTHASDVLPFSCP